MNITHALGEFGATSDAIREEHRRDLDKKGYTLLPGIIDAAWLCLLYTSPSPRDATLSRMPSSA